VINSATATAAAAVPAGVLVGSVRAAGRSSRWEDRPLGLVGLND